jgi:hypothetical protein
MFPKEGTANHRTLRCGGTVLECDLRATMRFTAIVAVPSACPYPAVQPGCTNLHLDALLRSAAVEAIRCKWGQRLITK